VSTTALDILIRAKDQASGAIKQVGGSVDETAKKAEAGGSKMTRFGNATSSAGEKVRGAIKGMAAAAGFVAIDEMASKSLEAFDALEVGEKRLGYGLNAIGESKKNLDGLTSWAKSFSSQTGVAESDIVGMQSKLTAMGGTFLKSLGPNADGTIKKITSGMVNLGSATGKSASLLLRSLGPALMNDPATAASQLVRYGVLTDAQEAKIKKLTAAGKTHAASMMEINALYSKYNGVAAASETPMDKLKNGINQVELTIGSLISRGLEWLITTGWPAMKNGISTVIQKAQPFIAMLRTASAGVLPALKQAFTKLAPQVKQLWTSLAPIAKVLGIIVGLVAIGLLKSLPILIKIIAIQISAWLKIQTVLAGVVVGAFRAVINVVQNLINWGKNLVNWVQTGFSKIVSIVGGLSGRISKAASGMWDTSPPP
jgi:phage-related protein